LHLITHNHINPSFCTKYK